MNLSKLTTLLFVISLIMTTSAFSQKRSGGSCQGNGQVVHGQSITRLGHNHFSWHCQFNAGKCLCDPVREYIY